MDIGRLVGVPLGTLVIGGWQMSGQNSVAAVGLQITVYNQAHLPPEVSRSTSDQLRLILQQSGIAIELVAGDLAADEASLFTYIGGRAPMMCMERPTISCGTARWMPVTFSRIGEG